MLLFNLVIKLYSINEKPLKEVLADVPPVTEQLTIYKIIRELTDGLCTIVSFTIFTCTLYLIV